MADFTQRTMALAEYILQNKSTIRDTAKHFCMAKSTVHYDLNVRLKTIDFELYKDVKKLLKFNFLDKHNRGGASTKLYYKNKKIR